MEETLSEPSLDDDRSLKAAESLRAFRRHAEETLGDHRNRVSEIETRLNEQLQLVAEELSRERLSDEQSLKDSAKQSATLNQVQQTLAEKEAEVEEVLDQLATQSLQFESLVAERDAELEQLLELCEEETRQRETLQQERDSAKQAFVDLEAQECSACAFAQNALSETNQQLSNVKAEFDELQIQHTALQTELEETQQTAQTAQQAHAQASEQLAASDKRIAGLSQQVQDFQENAEQLEQTQRKFELALADVHKLKRENAELHEELLSRPAADAQESPELVSLRAERDALAERVAELETGPVSDESSDNQQELEDLQSRFELAVDDVRQLKQEKADLEQRLSATPAAAVELSEAQDWQSQKARLLATLDAEDQGSIDEQRREQRATIEGTISITDRVVAEKDTQLAKFEDKISDLQAQLESRPDTADTDALREEIAAEILGNDDAIKTELTRLREQQEQLDAKLREAELEISVQRATIAREQAALDEQRANFPDSAEDAAEDSSSDKPRRRWLTALGIKEEEDED